MGRNGANRCLKIRERHPWVPPPPPCRAAPRVDIGHAGPVARGLLQVRCVLSARDPCRGAPGETHLVLTPLAQPTPPPPGRNEARSDMSGQWHADFRGMSPDALVSSNPAARKRVLHRRAAAPVVGIPEERRVKTALVGPSMDSLRAPSAYLFRQGGGVRGGKTRVSFGQAAGGAAGLASTPVGVCLVPDLHLSGVTYLARGEQQCALLPDTFLVQGYLAHRKTHPPRTLP